MEVKLYPFYMAATKVGQRVKKLAVFPLSLSPVSGMAYANSVEAGIALARVRSLLVSPVLRCRGSRQ